MSHSPTVWITIALCLGGCSAVVDFDRSRLVDAGVDASGDSGVSDDEEDAAVEAAALD